MFDRYFKIIDYGYFSIASNLVPRVSHLNAWGERGGLKMRDPGNEVELQAGNIEEKMLKIHKVKY